jgi:hypothetical protein
MHILNQLLWLREAISNIRTVAAFGAEDRILWILFTFSKPIITYCRMLQTYKFCNLCFYHIKHSTSSCKNKNLIGNRIKN